MAKLRNKFAETEVNFQISDEKPSTEGLLTSTDNPASANNFRGIYVNQAYRITDEKIRIIYLQNNNNRDPNAHVFRHAATAFMHDCMLRARNVVRFVSNSDLDDLPISTNMNISRTLLETEARHPDAGQFLVDWILAIQQQYWDRIRTPKDVQFNLDKVKVVDRDNIRFDYQIAKKIFHRPERVEHFDQHNVFGNEKSEKDGKYFSAVEMFDNPNLFFLHLRRFERLLLNDEKPKLNATFNYEILGRLNRKMKKLYLKRINGTAFEDLNQTPWALEARETLRNLEQCRLEGFGTKLTRENEMCQQSSAGCSGLLTAGIEFIKAPLTWINIAHSAEFNSYLKKNHE
ncbi:unnamed protein product [Caenorhabditis bovis]|uniref:Glycosyltransferase family 92 protein n=1 Tax=Caenorhabditis bovis TaxID=2654633 RepID=A0A8S1E8S4_9PELO|nr:unnamed protein product [Caenorhabditis bovis]